MKMRETKFEIRFNHQQGPDPPMVRVSRATL